MIPETTLTELAAEPPSGLIRHLNAVGYTLDGVARLVGEPDPTVLLSDTARCALLYGDELAASGTPLGVLAQLFLLGGQVRRCHLDEAVPAGIRSLLEKRSLIRHDGELTEAAVTIVEFESKYFVSDRLFANHGNGEILFVDHPAAVWPMATWSLTLYSRLSRDPALRSLLDIGCGTGCLALLTHERYARAVGIDLNPRAVAFATLNAALNGVTNVRFAVADCLTFDDPMRFDHIAFAAPSGPNLDGAQPALVSHGGRLGHELVLDFLAKRLDSLLNPDGRAQAWAIFALRGEPLNTLLSQALPHPTHIDPIREGGLYVSPTAITARALPWNCHYADTSLQPYFLDLLITHGITELLPAVLTVKL